MPFEFKELDFTYGYDIISENELDSIIKDSDIIQETDTLLSDYIRILKRDEEIFIQETSDKKEILIRKMNDMDEAKKFVKERLDFYERKWDGCGCKIDYYK